MGEIIKAYMGMFFFLLELILGVSVVTMGVEEQAAQNYHADVIEEIESSNFSPSVIQACKTQAQDCGYELEVNVIMTDADNNIQMAEVVLKYSHSMDILEITEAKEKRGIAR